MANFPFSFTPVTLDDVDQYQEFASVQGWQLNSRQLSRGRNQINCDQLVLPDLFIGHHHVFQAVYDVFDIPSDHIVFVICRAKLPTVWCGVNIPPTVLAIHHPVRTYWARHPAGWETYEFCVSRELVERTELFPPSFLTRSLRLEQAFLPLVEPQTQQFLETMDSCFQMTRNANGMLASVLSGTEIYNVILHGLQNVIDAGLAADGTISLRPTRRPDLVAKAMDLMSANLKLDFAADEIAQSLGVSYRVLNYAFRDTLGVSLYQYFMTEKLHAVRRELKTSDAPIAEACKSYGFSTPSRFTRQYKRLFGKLPSEAREGKPAT